ncbi:Crp/Fnr family transcriptional regulator [Lentzea sp. NBRC 105346]|uniref:Crp/Fnr family transcriptional regulator n=1 Tax=Lentzea sp. NBRC 105346 TaxID=3032205 RepID=UPI0024A09506|nr:Crp/Fnr family transcriptional regulator [Lentzea sp. NBRC 105346]GLZ35502.1 Crp/Fnr family transcriptional regulator [Lentzea sp. NBRC 105346]
MPSSLDSEAWPRGSLLAGLSPKMQAVVLELGTPVMFGSHHVLLREGERSTHVILLVDGFVKVTATTQEGRLALLAIRVGGEIVGELGSLDDQPRSADVTTVGRVHGRVITQADFRRCLAEHAEIALAVARNVGQKLRWATRRRIDFAGLEVKVRLARVLVELAARYGRDTADGLMIDLELTQPELAALVGAAEPTIHKALAELRRRGVIETRYRCTVVRDLVALCAAAGVDPP